jgi:hypothetical protein
MVTRAAADEIVKNNGYHLEEVRAVKIIEFDDAWGGTSYGLVPEGAPDRYAADAAVRNPRVYWEAPCW